VTPAPGSGAQNTGRSPIKQALDAIERLQARLDLAESARTEPIAIVGLSCRFPGGASSPDAYWRVLAGGIDAITEVPPERWDLARVYDPDPATPGKMYTRHGGFLSDVGGFDAWFFRISPREATSLDPQQRLLLEVAWEALEDAGIPADRLSGTPTGVFVGMTTNDYAQLLLRGGEARPLDAFFFTGNPANAAAGRLAYTFGFQGPALAIDTACSSSLVAVHQACASLRAGECRTALAGGVNLVLAPEVTIAVCRTRALSPDGRCKTFDARANGFVRSEGCGLVVLKRLSDALADQDPIRAVIRGSAINQDGATSGFTVPNGPAQQAVIRAALGSLPPSSIDYLEAHGTGTPLGDPIEVGAAAAVLGDGRDAAHPLYIGSAKTNIGHAEAAAGVAALIKSVLAIEHAEIPPHLHFDTPNPLIPWDTLPVLVPREPTPWPRTGLPRRAGVSAFGASGTNAHVILEEAPAVPATASTGPQRDHLLVVSAKRREALVALAARYRALLTTATPDELGDICYSAATGRVHHRHRLAIVAATAAEATAKLDAAVAAIAGRDASADGEPPVPSATDEDARDYDALVAAAAAASSADDHRSKLERAASLYVRGVDLDWRAFNPSFPRRRVALPTYPFQRSHYWIDTQDERMQTTTNSNAVMPPRRDAVLAVLRKYIAELLQAPESEINVHLPFLEMGADSLVMVDAIGLVEKEFGLKLAIRRFFEDLSTIDALAGFIDAAMPAGAPATQPAPATASVPSATPAPAPVPVTSASSSASATALFDAASSTAGTTPFERVLVEQTRFMAQFMAQQAEIMRMALGAPASAVAAPAPAAPPVAPSAAQPQANAPVPKPAATGATGDAARVAPAMPWGNPAEIRARGLTSVQHAHLEALIDRYTARTPRSKARTQQYRSVLADSRATVGFRLSTKEMLYPIWGARTAGSRTWDIDDNEYIDFTMGFGVHLFGHKPDFVQAALRDDVDRAVELGARSDLAGEVAQLFTELTGLDRVAFSNSGTEAVMAAVRLARAKTGRDKIAIFTNAYHGHADTTLARAQNTGGVLASVPMAPGVPGSIATDIIVLDYGSDESLDIIRRRGHEIAAVMVEPVQSRHLKQQPRAFLHALRSLTTEIGSALIFDEMITGFRAHLGGAQAYFGVKADLATYGKIVGGGMPIGLVAGAAEFMDGVDGGMWEYGDGSFPAADRTAFGGTFCQHPLSMAAARATLLELKARGPALQQTLNDRTDAMMRRLNDYFTAERVPIEATNFSSLFRFEFSSNLDLLFYHMLEKGIYIWEWRSCFLSTAHSDADVDRFVDVIQESIGDLRRGGFAPRSISGPTSPSGAGPSTTDRTGATYTAPLTDAQRQLWLLTEIEPTSSIAYNVSTSLELQGALDRDRLLAALQAVVDRHSALRTTIAPDGQCQIVHASTVVTLPVNDLSSAPEVDRARALDNWREHVSRQPLDLVNGPVFRPQLVRLADDRHVLMLTAHHILADGMTMGVILQELTAFYNDAATAAARPAPMQFSEYVALCEQTRGSAEMQAHQAFWTATFADGVPELDLPLDRVRPRVKTYTGGRVTTEIDGPTLEALKRVSRQHGCTLNMSLITIFALLLHRFSGQDDVIVGTSVTGRPFRGSMEMAGYCTHLVPVRSRLVDDPTFSDLVRAMKSHLLDVFDHQDLPFSELLHTLPIQRRAGAFPLISAVFNLEPVSTLPAFDGLTSRLLPQAVSFTPFDLFVNITEGGTTLLIDTDFNEDLFDASTVKRMMGSFDTLVRAAVATPSATIRRLPLLSPAERLQQFVEWNRTATVYPDRGCVHTTIEATAAARPAAIAVEFERRTLTYAELNARANQLASWLESRGVGPDVLVGVCCERSLELIIAVLGVLKAGGAYVPIDPDYPDERVAFMLDDARPLVVLTEARWAGRITPFAGEILRLDADWYRIARMDASNPGHAATGEQLAYMIYTSGSTGRPKGALNTHAGIANRLQWMQATYALTPSDRVLQKTPFSFDVSVWELLWPLMVGARLVMAAPGGHRDPRYLVDLIERAGITTIHFVPSMLSTFLEEPDLARCRSLKRVICSGEALSPELLRRATALLDAPLHNLYGPTEAAIDVTSWACDVSQAGANVPIGKPIANTQIYLLDARRQPVPVGVTGELYIGGVGVGRGYLNRPDLTRERFLPDPFTGGAARLYRTGDLARFRPDGNIEFLGRIDGQVKIRGFRIELGEIETRLLAYPGVSAAVAVADDTGSGDKRDTRLIAYVVVADRGPDLAASLTEHLARALPDYMVPSAIIALDAMPLLSSGKIDRSRLPAVPAAGTHVPPEPGAEAEIAAIWEDVLRQAPVGATDDFFALGGNSLSAAQAVSRIERRLGLAVGLKDLFTNPTVRALAAALARVTGAALPPIERAPVQPDYPLSHAERSFWIQDRLADATRGNGHPTSFLLEGPLDIDALRRAFDALVARHEILRTVFVEANDDQRQRVLAPADSGFALAVTMAAESDLDPTARAVEARQAAARMDLATGPLLCAELITAGGLRHVCVCTMHHAITDGWSVGVLQNDLTALYDAFATGNSDPLAPLPFQYKDFAVWESGMASGPAFAGMRAFWQAAFRDDVPDLELPSDVAGPRGAFTRATREIVIDRNGTSGLESAARRQGATLFMALLACIKVLLYRHTAQGDIVVGTPVSARAQPELEHQIGPYLNVLPLRDRLAGDDTIAAVIERVRRTALDAFAHQQFPFDLLVQALRLERRPGRNPLFDVGFTLQNQLDVQMRESSRHLQITEIRRDIELSSDAEAETDLWFIVRPDEGELAVQVVYNGARFSPGLVDRLLQDLLAIVSAAAPTSDTTLKSIVLTANDTGRAGRKITIDLGL
jgi:amino acid adenylation domain-containing protein